MASGNGCGLGFAMGFEEIHVEKEGGRERENKKN